LDALEPAGLVAKRLWADECVSSVKRRGLAFRECASQPKAHDYLNETISNLEAEDKRGGLRNS
jgi:hypothetical protein